MSEVNININDPKETKKQKVRAEVTKMNANAVGAKLREFETRIGKQDLLIAGMQAKLLAMEKRLDIQRRLEAVSSRIGRGPTT
jgi:hypothetical protein